MGRFIDYDYSQTTLLPVNFEEQILPGSFEYTLCYLVDHEVDMSLFEARYCNDATGRLAYDPALLLKIVLYAYSKGITSSRQIAWQCRYNIMFMALSADTQPHFTTIAAFISSVDDAVAKAFRDVLMVCDAQGLIGHQMFAIDGVKLPSNASKEWSGTRADFEHKVKKIERAVRRMLSMHQREDAKGEGTPLGTRRRDDVTRPIEVLRAEARKLRGWLKDHDDKPGRTGKPRKSNMTDNDSAKMLTGHGVIQGYAAVASVDAKYQIVVQADAAGEPEQSMFNDAIEGIGDNLQGVLSDATIVADSGFHSDANVKHLLDRGIDAYIADVLFRKRDPRFIDADMYKRTRDSDKPRYPYPASEFVFADDLSHCICPQGKRLYRSGANCQTGNYMSVRFKGPKSTCAPCPMRHECLRHPERTAFRQVAYFKGRTQASLASATEKMKRRIDSAQGRHLYSKRLGIVEPVFGNIRTTLGLDRFSLRGRAKVNQQWLLYCLVHNVGKLHRYGWAA